MFRKNGRRVGKHICQSMSKASAISEHASSLCRCGNTEPEKQGAVFGLLMFLGIEMAPASRWVILEVCFCSSQLTSLLTPKFPTHCYKPLSYQKGISHKQGFILDAAFRPWETGSSYCQPNSYVSQGSLQINTAKVPNGWLFFEGTPFALSFWFEGTPNEKPLLWVSPRPKHAQILEHLHTKIVQPTNKQPALPVKTELPRN